MSDVFPQAFPTLETERLILREITDDDASAIFKNFSDPEIAIWFFEQPLENIEQARAFITAFGQEFTQGEGLTWVMVLKETGTSIGTCGFGEVEMGQHGDLGFDLAREHWGKGLMKEGLGAIMEYGFGALNLSVIKAHSYSSNLRAIRLLEKLGFKMERVEGDSSYFALARKYQS
jgi:ribosomal-protein-alanine N-acetyltransferase